MSRFLRRQCRVVAIISVFLCFVILFLKYAHKQTHFKAKTSLKEEKKIDVKANSMIVDDSALMTTSKLYKQLPLVADKPGIISSNVHAFYYGWYGNIVVDNYYYHWNHRFLPHWTKKISDLYATGERHSPPDDIGSNFFPKLGPYSSYDQNVIEQHMSYFVQAGIGVLALSWYPVGKSDDEGKPMNDLVPVLLDVAKNYKIKICFHIEPYKGRTSSSVADDIEYLIRTYGSHPAFYTTTNHFRNPDRSLPLVYVYDSYLIPTRQWSRVLGDGKHSIRGKAYDAIVIGLLVEKKHKIDIAGSGFDGFYTYFASSGFSYGSDIEHWRSLADFASASNLIFIPSVGPGYDDTNVRPWNGGNTKKRDDGRYYDTMWSKAIETRSRLVSITSFNEWHEGTQIEPAEWGKTVEVPYVLGKKRPGKYSYEDYGANPNLYLDLTRKWVEKFVTN